MGCISPKALSFQDGAIGLGYAGPSARMHVQVDNTIFGLKAQYISAQGRAMKRRPLGLL